LSEEVPVIVSSPTGTCWLLTGESIFIEIPYTSSYSILVKITRAKSIPEKPRNNILS
jgi:hypothetical protein